MSCLYSIVWSQDVSLKGALTIKNVLGGLYIIVSLLGHSQYLFLYLTAGGKEAFGSRIVGGKEARLIRGPGKRVSFWMTGSNVAPLF